MDWTSVGQQIISMGAPILGGVLGSAIGMPGPGAALGTMVGKQIATALGVEATPDAVSAAITADPAGAQAKLQALESANATELGMLKADIEDRASARSSTLSLASIGSAMAWGAPTVSMAVLAAFFMMLYAVTFTGLPAGSDNTIVIGLIELLKQLTVAVVFYWVGSSSGSKRSSDTVREIARNAVKRP